MKPVSFALMLALAALAACGVKRDLEMPGHEKYTYRDRDHDERGSAPME